jgi:hypothetical protein
MNRLATGTRLRLTELGRQPTTLALLVGLPPVVIEVYGLAMATFPTLPTLGTAPATAGRLTGTQFAVAFLAGLVGLFQVISARHGDERLALCGYPTGTLLASRLVALVAVAGIGAAVSFGVFAWRVDVPAPLLAVGFLALAGLVYGLIGVVLGTLLPRELEGSLVLVFMADMDNVLASGLFEVEGALATLAPLGHPHELFQAAVLRGELADGHLLPVVGWLAVLLVVAVVGYARATDGGVVS